MTTKTTPPPPRQTLMWLPPESNVPFTGKGPAVLPCPEGEPTRVWTLVTHTDPAKPPALPFVPQHNVNAFFEDYVHDWNMSIDGKSLRYGSRVTEGGCWLLLEYLPPRQFQKKGAES